MNNISAGLEDIVYLFTQTGKIGGKDGWSNQKSQS
jgi:hypothetical protein